MKSKGGLVRMSEQHDRCADLAVLGIKEHIEFVQAVEWGTDVVPHGHDKSQSAEAALAP